MPDFMKAEFAAYEQAQEQKAFMAKMQRDVGDVGEEPAEDAPLPSTAKELERKLTNVKTALQYIHAGKATFTLRSLQTGTRFTYRVIKPKQERHNPHSRFPYDDNIWFVKVLYGPDNNTMYRYMGLIRRTEEPSVAYPSCKITVWKFYPSQGYKHREVATSKCAKAFQWMYTMLQKNQMPIKAEIWHSGTCGACGRLLTVPESIANGIGPVCASKMY